MNFRKVISNVLVAFVVFPLLMRVKYWYNFQINPLEQFGSIQGIIINDFFRQPLYFIMSFIFLLFVLLPFQLIKDDKLNKNKKKSLVVKSLILSCILCVLIILFGTFSNIWWIPWYKNFLYVGFALFLGFFIAILLHFLVDIYEEKAYQDKQN